MLRRLLLLPLLSPLLAVLLVGALNPGPALPLRLLIWRSPALPIGAWMAMAAGTGAGLSGAAAALALGDAAAVRRRQVRRRPAPGWSAARQPQEPWDEGDRSPSGRSRRSGQEAPPPQDDSFVRQASGPARAPGEPAPTVAVPFRVLHRAEPAGTAVDRRDRRPEPAPERQPVAVAADDDWAGAEQDDW